MFLKSFDILRVVVYTLGEGKKMTTTAKKTITVQKYGGTSVGSIERIKTIAKRIIRSYDSSKRVVAVVSAMGKSTDTLVKLAKDIC